MTITITIIKTVDNLGPPPVPALTVGEMLDLLNSMSQVGDDSILEVWQNMSAHRKSR